MEPESNAGATTSTASLLSQLRRSLTHIYDTFVASSRTLNSIQEFSGGGAYKEWLQTFRSQCGTLSTAYQKILTGSRLDENDIRPFKVSRAALEYNQRP